MVLLDYLIWFNRSSVGCVSEFHFAKNAVILLDIMIVMTILHGLSRISQCKIHSVCATNECTKASKFKTEDIFMAIKLLEFGIFFSRFFLDSMAKKWN